LFMNVAAMECSEDAVLGFTRRYGLLDADGMCSHVRFGYTYDAEADPDERAERFGQSLETWYATIRQLKLAVDLWDASKLPTDDDACRTLRRLELAEIPEVHGRDPFSVAHAAYFGPGNVRIAFTREDARKAVQALVLAEFDGEVTWSFGRALPHNRDVLELTPESLRSGLWLQFAAALAAESQFKTCEYCGHFYDGSTARKSKKYCSDSCKSANWNRDHPSKVREAQQRRGRRRNGAV